MDRRTKYFYWGKALAEFGLSDYAVDQTADERPGIGLGELALPVLERDGT
jgi:hypothetical protein